MLDCSFDDLHQTIQFQTFRNMLFGGLSCRRYEDSLPSCEKSDFFDFVDLRALEDLPTNIK
jgi:hypothetical protein